MGEITAISWCDHTWSPWTGCTRVGPGCDGCYAAHLMDTRMHRVEWGEPGTGEGTRSLMSDAYWRKPLAWNREAAKTGVRPFVFPSLCDPFDTAVPEPWRWRFVELIEATPNLVWLLLTKRIGNVLKLTDPCRGERTLPPNAAIGATFVNQNEYDRDRMKLWEVKQRLEPLFTFGSFEPLLGLVILDKFAPDWIITGGETDQGAHEARPAHPDWYRKLRDGARTFGRLYQHKQNGEFSDFDHIGMAWNDLPDRVRVQQKFVDGKAMIKVGKHRSGRLLDGVEHNARPEVA